MVLNPQAKTSADVTIFALAKDSLSNVSEKSGFVIAGPGEYEIKDIFIKGFPGANYLVILEGIRVCYLSNPNPTEEFDDVDILLTSPAHYKSAVALEPSIIIPMGHDKASLAQFLREAGAKDVESLDKLVVKKKDLEGKKGEVVVLKEE